MDLFLDDLVTGGYSLDCGEDELPRARYLAKKYADLPLGFADAAVVACTEANGKPVLTLDTREFSVPEKKLGSQFCLDFRNLERNLAGERRFPLVVPIQPTHNETPLH